METPFALPRNEQMVAATVNETHVLARVDAGVWGLHLQLYIPQGWKIVDRFETRIERPGEPMPLALFVEQTANGVEPALISVVGYRLDVEIGLEDWVNHIVAQRGEIPFGGASIKTPAGLCWDAGVAQGLAPDRRFSRVTAYSAVGVIFLITSQCDERQWSKFQDAFLAANFSFELLNRAGGRPGQLEPWQEWTTTGHPQCRVAIPASWKIEPVESRQPTTETVDAKLIDEDASQVLGYLRLKVKIDRFLSPEAIVQKWMQKLKTLGFELPGENPASSRELGILEKVEGLQGIWVGKTVREGEGAEVRIIVLQRDRVQCAVLSIGPAQQVQPFLWMRNKRAGEIAALTLRVS